MALRLRPPTHKIDALGVFISAHDPAWDDDAYKADVEVMLAAALKAKQDAAVGAIKTPEEWQPDELIKREALRAAVTLTDEERHKARAPHPVVRYLRGLTRWQPNAPDHDPHGKPCTVRERYIKGQPCEFTIRRLPYAAYQAADAIENSAERLTAFARASLRAIKSPDWNWEATGERVPDDVMQALHDADPSLLLEIGQAVISLCRPLDEVETFR